MQEVQRQLQSMSVEELQKLFAIVQKELLQRVMSTKRKIRIFIPHEILGSPHEGTLPNCVQLVYSINKNYNDSSAFEGLPLPVDHEIDVPEDSIILAICSIGTRNYPRSMLYFCRAEQGAETDLGTYFHYAENLRLIRSFDALHILSARDFCAELLCTQHQTWLKGDEIEKLMVCKVQNSIFNIVKKAREAVLCETKPPFALPAFTQAGLTIYHLPDELLDETLPYLQKSPNTYYIFGHKLINHRGILLCPIENTLWGIVLGSKDCWFRRRGYTPIHMDGAWVISYPLPQEWMISLRKAKQ